MPSDPSPGTMPPARAERFTGYRRIGRILVTWLVTGVSLKILSAIIPGLTVGGWRSALAAAAWIGILNALIWPLLIRFALPITVMTLGLAGLILNGVLVWAVDFVVEGFDVEGIGWGILVTFALTVINTAVTSLLAIDDDDFYYRNVVKRAARRRGAIASDVPGLYFLEIDGLAHCVLVRAIRDGNAPTLARWLRDGSHRLLEWETDWSSQTGASQTGLLHGCNEDIPAFRWWERETQRAMASSSPKNVMELEARISNGKGLLHADGASRANMYSGDAPHSLLTISTVLRKREGRLGQDYFAYFSNPYSFTRTICLVVADVLAELTGSARQRRLDVWPRIRRGLFPYPLMRAWMTVVQRDLQVLAVMGDAYAGRPVVYTTFSGYDEMAHHAGIERAETLEILRKLDRQLARLEAAAADAPRPIRFAVLSDHGQTQGATFRQRYGLTLEELVTAACRAETVAATEQGDEGFMYLGAMATEAASGTGVTNRAVRRATEGKRVEGEVVLGPERERAGARKGEGEVPEVVVMASGNLGLVYFPREPQRLTLERLNELYPDLVPTLRGHPGIGFFLVRSAAHGAVVLGPSGARFLDEERVEGDDPLAPFGPNAARHVHRTDGFPHCADVMLNSAYWPDTDEVAAFEELVGSHGGIGGPQAHPFALVPSDLTLPHEPVVGAEELHRWMRRWLAELGHDAYRDDGAAGQPA